jgi:pyruvate formate lyase activating enzyme
MVDITPYVFKIQRYCLHDGPGIRTTLFFQGCPLSCAWCHNPESQAMGVALNPMEAVTQAALGSDNPFGELVETLVREIEKDVIFYDESGGGVTFSGGEPLSRPDLLLALVAACRDRGIHTCLDTSGFAPFNILRSIATAVDLVLFDIKIMANKDHLALTGQPVGLVLENLKKLSLLQVNKKQVNLKLRFPLIPTMTDTLENMDQILAFLTQETRFRQIHILPFHATGQAKYERLKRNYVKQINPPTDEQVEKVRLKFEAGGFKTMIGG